MKTIALINKIIILSIFLFGNAIGSAQTVHDLTTAKAIALAENKLIIVDFWATWCKPCLKMDEELWNSKEFDRSKSKFVLAKINVSNNIELAQQFSVKSIPRVLILAANEDRIFDKSGYRNANEYLDLFNSFPDSYSDLNHKLQPFINSNKATPDEMYSLAEEFSKIAKNSRSEDVKAEFISISNSYFSKSGKKTDSEELEMLASVSQLRNDIYLGKFEKINKKLTKLKLDEKFAKVMDIKYFLLASCYKNEGNLTEMNTVASKILNADLILELETSTK